MPIGFKARRLLIADWTLRILLALTFLAAGAAKLSGASQMVALFDQIGVGQWFRSLTGAIEIAGGFLVLPPRSAIHGAGLLACTMAGAVFTHLALIGGNPLPAIVLLLLCTAVLWLRRKQVPRTKGFAP